MKRLDRGMTRRLLAGTLAVTVTALAGLIGASGPAQAQTDVVCQGSQSTTYTPGLALAARPTTFTAAGTLTLCQTSDPSVTSGTYQLSGSGNLSCTAGSGSGTYTITWNDNSTSTVSYVNAVTLRPLGVTVVLEEGSVTAGRFAGSGVVRVITLFPSPVEALQCLSSTGVTGSTGLVETIFV